MFLVPPAARFRGCECPLVRSARLFGPGGNSVSQRLRPTGQKRASRAQTQRCCNEGRARTTLGSFIEAALERGGLKYATLDPN